MESKAWLARRDLDRVELDGAAAEIEKQLTTEATEKHRGPLELCDLLWFRHLKF